MMDDQDDWQAERDDQASSEEMGLYGGLPAYMAKPPRERTDAEFRDWLRNHARFEPETQPTRMHRRRRS